MKKPKLPKKQRKEAAQEKRSKVDEKRGCFIPLIDCSKPGDPIESVSDGGILMHCTRENCPHSPITVHEKCFKKLEERLILALKTSGASRKWPDWQLRHNLWISNGLGAYHKLLACPCGGLVHKDRGYNLEEQSQGVNDAESISHESDKKGKIKSVPELNDQKMKPSQQPKVYLDLLTDDEDFEPIIVNVVQPKKPRVQEATKSKSTEASIKKSEAKSAEKHVLNEVEKVAQVVCREQPAKHELTPANQQVRATKNIEFKKSSHLVQQTVRTSEIESPVRRAEFPNSVQKKASQKVIIAQDFRSQPVVRESRPILEVPKQKVAQSVAKSIAVVPKQKVAQKVTDTQEFQSQLPVQVAESIFAVQAQQAVQEFKSQLPGQMVESILAVQDSQVQSPVQVVKPISAVQNQQIVQDVQDQQLVQDFQVQPLAQVVKPISAVQNQQVETIQQKSNKDLSKRVIIEEKDFTATNLQMDKFNDEQTFLFASTRVTILNMVNEFVYWKNFQLKYKSVWKKSFKSSLHAAGYEKPSKFFAEHSLFFDISKHGDQRILKIKGATSSELKSILADYTKIVHRLLRKLDSNGRKSQDLVKISDSIKFRNIWYK